MEALKAGHGRRCITPPLGTAMMGYAARTQGAQDVHDDLFVNAVALTDGHASVGLLAYDLCLMDARLVEEVKGAVRQATELEPAQVFVNASHTHAGPALGSWHEKSEDKAYRRLVVQKGAEAMKDALEDAALCTFSAGAAGLDIGCNRRERRADGTVWLGHNPGGQRLAELTAWRFARRGKPRILLFSTPMHGTTLGQQNLSISAEWMGLAIRHIEKKSPRTRAVFLQGCGADQDPYYSMKDGNRGSFGEADAHGRAAAQAVAAALKHMRRLQPLPIRTVMRTVPLPGKEDGSTALPLSLHGLRLGDAVLLGLGCEAFVEFALFGRAISKAQETLILGYTDGSIGYLCTARVFPQGGYEPQTSRLAPRSEHLVKEAMQAMLAELTQ